MTITIESEVNVETRLLDTGNEQKDYSEEDAPKPIFCYWIDSFSSRSTYCLCDAHVFGVAAKQTIAKR